MHHNEVFFFLIGHNEDLALQDFILVFPILKERIGKKKRRKQRNRDDQFISLLSNNFVLGKSVHNSSIHP